MPAVLSDLHGFKDYAKTLKFPFAQNRVHYLGIIHSTNLQLLEWQS